MNDRSVPGDPAAVPDPRSWWSQAILIGAVIAAVLLPLGALGTRFGIWTFSAGFLLLAAGTVLAAIGLVVGIAGIIAVIRRNLAADKPAVYLGTLVSALILCYMGLQFFAASSVPPIHNISTDVDDPPQFATIVNMRAADANPLDYDTAALAPLQQAAYPWVQPLQTALTPDQALSRAERVLEDMGLEVVNYDEVAGRVEAVATTFWFGFQDDVVVRVRPEGSGSRVDVRSVSRVGRSDLGTNARRIGEFLKAFAET